MPDTTKTLEPILASWKISEVLRRYPQLLDVLLEISPAFSHLRNPVLRRIQTRLATVAQAARIAGLEPPALVQRLNAAIGLAAPDAASGIGPAGEAISAAPLPFEDAPVAVELDVRGFQQRGEEPFGAIMAAVAQVPAGQALRLRNTFEPVPLYQVLGKRGFAHSARQLGPDDWEILFLKVEQRQEQSGADRPSASNVALADSGQPAPEGWEDPSQTVTIDVSDLVPPEPMVRILETMEQLSPGQTLLVHHARRPVYLYPRLDALGYRHETRELGPEQVEILIHKPAAD